MTQLAAAVDALVSAAARPRQSYIVTVAAEPVLDDGVAVIVTARQVRATMLIAALLPARVSPGAPVFPVPFATTHRRRPAFTSAASQLIVTELSLPENPPSPATAPFEERIAAAALLWLATPIVPPPCAAA
jgi:hypothetical protein